MTFNKHRPGLADVFSDPTTIARVIAVASVGGGVLPDNGATYVIPLKTNPFLTNVSIPCGPAPAHACIAFREELGDDRPPNKLRPR